MALSSRTIERRDGDTLTISRSFDAPPELLFKLWADPAHRVRWSGPSGMALASCEIDFRVGGKWSMVMRATSYDHAVHGEFTEIAEFTRLCFTYINEYDGHEMLVEMDFVPEGNGTRMHLVQSPFVSVSERDNHRYGWTSTLSMLATYAIKVRDAGGKVVGQPRQPGDY